MEREKMIRNANVLDLRNATEASVARVRRIDNSNVVVYTKETAGLLSRIDIGNANVMLEVPSDVEVEGVTGQVLVKADHFKNHPGKLFLLVIGQVVFERDVPAEDIDRGLAGLVVVGQIVYPEPLAGVIHTKTRQVIGQTLAYPPFEHVHIGALAVDETYLNGLDDGSEVAVVGSVLTPRPIPDDLLRRKLGKLFVSGRLLCHEENAATFRRRLTSPSTKVVAVPAGFKLIDKRLVLDHAILESLSQSKLYCLERVLVETDVPPSLFDEKVTKLIGEDLILCPTALKDVIPRKCDLLETNVLFYEGELWMLEDEHVLRPARFIHLAGKATLLVTGELTIDRGLRSETLLERVAKIHNRGVIRCTPDQMGAIEALLGLHDGVLEDATRTSEQEYWIENTTYLTL
jgi:hypothetical protein